MLIFRQRASGLLLSELGAFITSPAHAPAGTKRLGNLIRSQRWNATLLDAYHWYLAQQRQAELEAAGEASLVIWDTSELEKAESRHLEGMCAVRSMKAARLTRRRPGFTQPPLWYLLTNEPITTLDDGRQTVLAYARRWHIEQTWRFSKSELAMESLASGAGRTAVSCS